VENVVVFPAPRGVVAWKDETVEMFEAAGVGVKTFPHSRIFGTRSSRWGISLALARWLLANAGRFDVVHAHGAWTFTTLTALLASKVARRSAVLSTHESLTDFDIAKSRPARRALKRAARRFYLAASDLIIVSSELELRDTGTRHERVSVLPHALHEMPVPTRPRTDRCGLRVGCLTRLDPKKNVGLLLEAAVGCPDTFLDIAGTGPEPVVQSLRTLAHRLGLADRVVWRGFIDSSAKSTFFADVDVVVMPSEYECFGMAAAEAMCAGVPVVVSRSTGVARIVAEYDAGLVIEPTVRELRQALESLHEEGLLRDLRRGAAVAAHEFDLGHHGARLWNHYTRLTAARESNAQPLAGAGG
jgi:glycosyltransferase involved in cell wall biosynthesis